MLEPALLENSVLRYSGLRVLLRSKLFQALVQHGRQQRFYAVEGFLSDGSDCLRKCDSPNTLRTSEDLLHISTKLDSGDRRRRARLSLAVLRVQNSTGERSLFSLAFKTNFVKRPDQDAVPAHVAATPVVPPGPDVHVLAPALISPLAFRLVVHFGVKIIT